jgi:opacity protein-like surface antigen
VTLFRRYAYSFTAGVSHVPGLERTRALVPDNQHEVPMIKRLMFGVSAVALSMIAASPAHAQAHFGVSAGVSMPLSTFGDAVKSGYNATALLSYSMPLSPIGVRAELGYNRFDFDGGGGNSQIIDGAANLILGMPAASMIKPYVTGGLGVYRHKATATGILGFTDSQTKLGFNGGAGLSFGLTGFQTQLEARYVYITAESGGDPVKYVPISFGILF